MIFGMSDTDIQRIIEGREPLNISQAIENDRLKTEIAELIVQRDTLLAACQTMKAVRNVHSFSPAEIDRKKRAWDTLEAAIAAATSLEPPRGEGGEA